MQLVTKRLTLVWAAMAALTLAGIPLGHAGDLRPLGPALIVAVLGLAFVKTALLLNDYLDLRHAPAWNSGLRAGIASLLIVIAGLSIAARLA